MPKRIKETKYNNNENEIQVELTPVFVCAEEYQEKKEEIQNLITKIFISSHKRGRPSNSDAEELGYAA